MRWGRAGDAILKCINATWTSAFSGPVTQLLILKNVVLHINGVMLMNIESPLYHFQARDVFETTDPVVMQQRSKICAAAWTCRWRSSRRPFRS